MIGLTGAAIVGTGQFFHARSLSSGMSNCISSGNKKASCEAKYKNPYGTLGTITMYGGSIFIVAAWLILALIKSDLFGGMGMGFGRGTYQQQMMFGQ